MRPILSAAAPARCGERSRTGSSSTFVFPRLHPPQGRFPALMQRGNRDRSSSLCVRRRCSSRSAACSPYPAAASRAATRATLPSAAASAAAHATTGTMKTYFTPPTRCLRCDGPARRMALLLTVPALLPLQAIGRLLHRAFGLVDLAPSDLFAGLVLVRSRQKAAATSPRDDAPHSAVADDEPKGGAGRRPRGASSEALLFTRSRRRR